MFFLLDNSANKRPLLILLLFLIFMGYINFHTHQATKDDSIISIKNVFPEDYCAGNYSSDLVSVGIHPWHIQDDGMQQLKLLRSVLMDKKVVCIGEAGLDKLQGADYLIQESVFLEQIELSEEFNKPLIIHCVRAYNEIISLRKRRRPSSSWIFHGFSSSVQVLEQAIKAGFYFSFGAALLNHHSKTVQAFVKAPLERCFLETDEAGVEIGKMYRVAAKYRDVEGVHIEDLIMSNFDLLFK